MKQFATIAFGLLLAGCSFGSQSLLEMPQPASLNNDLVNPPWEALVEAGPNAYKDIDYETLDGPGADQVAAVDPTSTDAVPQRGAIKTVTVTRVKGAKGNGNTDLTEALKVKLQSAGWPVLEKAQQDSMTVSGDVKSSRDPNGEKIEITWHIKAPDGRLLGDVKQVNVVAKGSLNDGFGDAATAIADGAAAGIFDLVDKYR